MDKPSRRSSTTATRAASESSVATGDSTVCHDPKLRVGDRIFLCNLQSEQHNGKKGTIQSLVRQKPPPLDPSCRRFGILLDGEPKAIAVQAKNLVQIFSLQDRVALRGLQKDTTLNGQLGTVIQVPASPVDRDARYGVQMDGRLDQALIAVRAEKLYLGYRMSTQEQKELKEKLSIDGRLEPPSVTEQAEYVNQMAFLRTMIHRFTTEEQQIQIFGRKVVPIPEYWSEVTKAAGGLSRGVDQAWAKDYLRVAHENDSGLPQNFEMVFSDPTYEPPMEYIVKRLGNKDPPKLKWYLAANHQQAGAIYKQGCVGAPWYSPFHRHSFSNQTYRPEQLHRGTTHVAVGFVDLGILLTMSLLDPPTTAPVPVPMDDKNLDMVHPPLHFVGVELSPYSVAKAHVIWELLKGSPSSSEHPVEHCSHILQVWFSTTWASGTESKVKDCLERLCGPKSTHPDLDPQVCEILEYWRDADMMPLEAVRGSYREYVTESKSSIGNLLRQKDRVALARYETSGDFCHLPGQPPWCGNKIMFHCPDGTPPLEKNETIFSAFSMADIVALLKASPSLSIVQAAEQIALDKMAHLVALVQSNQVTMELICAPVECVVDEIAAKQPWTMSWSNLVDYFEYKDFHSLAKHCSRHGNTLHFGYSMNWTTIVYGTSLLDFCQPQASPLRKQILDQAHDAVETFYQKMGWTAYFRLPPPTNPLNTTSNFFLEPQWYQTWADFFFSTVPPDPRQNSESTPRVQVATVDFAAGTSLLSPTGSSTVYFTWTYDPNMDLKGCRDRKEN